MSARINHVAITSDYYAVNARFYESLFGMRSWQENAAAIAGDFAWRWLCRNDAYSAA